MQSSAASWGDFFAPCNRTELYQICRRNGIFVPPNTSRDDMVEYILGTKEPPEVGHPIDAWRHGIMGVIIEHADVVQATLNCPAKTLDPLACFQCTDTQVMSCVLQNPNDEHLIATRRLMRPSPRRIDTDMQSTITIATAPRDVEKLGVMSIFRLGTLAGEFSQTIDPRTGRPFFPAKTATDPDSKAAWSAFTSGKPATAAPIILALLQQYDAAVGGAPAPQAQPVAQPVAQPMAVLPQQVAAPMLAAPGPVMAAPGAQLAIPTGPAAAVAQPVTQPAAQPAAAAEPAKRGGRKVAEGGGDNTEVLAFLARLEQKVDVCTASVAALGQAVVGLKQNADANDGRIDDIEKLVRGIMKGTLWNLGVALHGAQAALGGGFDEIAGAAADMESVIPGLFEKAPPAGKA